MNAINERLLELEATGKPVMLGLIGAGQMGQEILCQVQLMKGLRIPLVVDITFERAELACHMARIPADRVDRVETPDAAKRAVAAGRTCGSHRLADRDQPRLHSNHRGRNRLA